MAQAVLTAIKDEWGRLMKVERVFETRGPTRRPTVKEAAEMSERSLSKLPLLEALPENLLRDPLEYLRADHLRLEAAADLLKEAVRTNGTGEHLDAEIVPDLVGFFETELPFHTADEMEDFLPLLRRGADPDSMLHALCILVSEGHARQNGLCQELTHSLRQGLTAGTIANPRRFWQMAGIFDELRRWTSETEERILIKYARQSVPRTALSEMGRSMAGRRHTTYPD